MYSTSIRNNRYFVKCIVLWMQTQIVNFIVDTGAEFTCCNYTTLGMDICEEDFAGNEIKFLGGFVKNLPVKFYKCRLKQFTIGSIDMGARDIWITFDERVTDTVLGMDILQSVIFAANPYNKKIYFCSDVEDFHKNFDLVAV